MSHFSTIKVNITDGDTLFQVLNQLGHQVQRNAKVRGYEGNRIQADYVVRRSNGYDFGFLKQGDAYTLVADFWGTGDPTEFINTVTQHYARKRLMATVKDQGFNVEAEETLEDGTMRLVVGRWI